MTGENPRIPNCSPADSGNNSGNSHDIQDLLNLIKQLENRIIQLEVELSKKRLVMEDAWYWDH